MNPHHTPGADGSGFGMPPQGPSGAPPQGHPPQGPPPGGPGQPLQSPPPPPGRYSAGVVAVLAVIAVLAGSAFVGGGLAAGHVVTSSLVEEEPEPEPTEEPTEEPKETPGPSSTPEPTPTEEPEQTEEPTLEPEDMLTAEEAVNELRHEFSIGARADTTDEYCTSEEDDEESASLFQCTSAMDTDLVRVIAFETSGAAMFTAMALENDEESDAVDVQDACHIVLIWFEENGLEQDERDEMTNLIEESVSCY